MSRMEDGRHICSVKQVYDIVYVMDESGNIIETYRALELAKKWFRTSNDSFFETYGFNWVPRGRYYEEARRQIEKEETHEINQALHGNPNAYRW